MKDLQRTAYLFSKTSAGELRPSITEVAFVGRSNAGKSSLLNALCVHKGLADVSKMPGRTRMINVYAAGHQRWLVDLPGYGFSMGTDELRKTWAKMIETYLTSRPSMQAIIVVMDSAVGPQKMDLEMVTWLKANQLPYILVGNKVDQIPGSKREKQLKQNAQRLQLPVTDIRWISCTHGTGIRELRKEVLELLNRDPQPNNTAS